MNASLSPVTHILRAVVGNKGRWRKSPFHLCRSSSAFYSVWSCMNHLHDTIGIFRNQLWSTAANCGARAGCELSGVTVKPLLLAPTLMLIALRTRLGEGVHKDPLLSIRCSFGAKRQHGVCRCRSAFVVVHHKVSCSNIPRTV